ncbi:MAG: aminotransferase class I/II-fold pyridoxal phosphate-dependent enzyme [Clostridia bacterium]|nr:aminotransferase class I/II-fold pyridoxal phosphate-dependent enzyme [Clostridia bacterium]
MLYNTKNPHGGDIYSGNITLDFSSSINPLGTPESVKDAVRRAAERIHVYPDPYCRRLTESVAEYENIKKENIIFGAGASELIYAYCGALLPGRAVLTAPTFSEYERALGRAGCEVYRYELARENGFALGEGFLDFIKEKSPDAVFLCNPNNPTGRLISERTLIKILDLCVDTGTAFFLDECFLDLTNGGESLKRYISECSGLFILKAFTKNFGMAGARLGYALTSDSELISKMSCEVQPWNVSVISQEAGLAALSETDFLKSARSLIEIQRSWLKKELEGLGFWVCPSDANFLMFYGEEGLHIPLKEQGIAIRNCADFHGLGEGWYRASVRIQKDNEALIKALTNAVLEKRYG